MIPPGSAIDPQVTTTSGVRFSRLVVKLHSMYRCSLARRTPYARSPAVDGNVLIVAVREYIDAFGSVSAPRPPLRVGAPSVLRCCLGAE